VIKANSVFILIVILFYQPLAMAVDTAPRISDMEIITQLTELKAGQTALNQRFEDQIKSINQRFEAVDKRFDAVDKQH